MNSENLDKLGSRFAKIAGITARIVGDDTFPVWLHVEAGDGWIGPSIYQELPNEIRWVDQDAEMDQDLNDEILETWEESRHTQPWSIFVMSINNGSFETNLEYLSPSQEDIISERREKWLEQQFGTKPVVYPPM